MPFRSILLFLNMLLNMDSLLYIPSCHMQDFLGDIWQSTCGNSSSVLPAGPPGLGDCLANSSLPPICVSNSIHQNSDVVLASQVAPGITSAQPFDLIQEETDGSAQFRFYFDSLLIINACNGDA